MTRNRTRLVSIKFFILCAAGYFVVVAILWSFQERLVFPAPKYPAGDWERVNDHPWLEEVAFESEDGTKLVGWLARGENDRAPALLCHGNGENVAGTYGDLYNLHIQLGLSVLSFDYRGYGKSAGSPTERGLLMDGRAAMKALNRLTETTPPETIIIGRSLGGGVAVSVATEVGAKALVLESTFSSIEDVAAARYWWAPVRWIIRTRMRAIDWIQSYHGPLLVSHGAQDTIVPIRFGERLFEACPSQDKQFYRQENVGHNDSQTRDLHVRLERFLQQVLSKD